MEYRSYRDTDCRPSLLGLGCMRLPTLEPGRGAAIDYARAGALVDEAVRGGITYFDVAYPYHGGGAEKFIGAALEKYPRESFYLATKMPLWKLETQEDMEQVFNEQLANCRVDYFDFYLCHAVDAERFEKIRRIGAFEFLARKKAEGKIRRLGFSFHDKPAVLRAICAAYPWDFAQLQLNYLDWTVQRAREQYEILQEYGLPCIVMEPVRGGALASLCPEAEAVLKAKAPGRSIASWAIRFAASLPGVLVVLSGMSSEEQLADNLAAMSPFQPLTKSEQNALTRAVRIDKRAQRIPCTGWPVLHALSVRGGHSRPVQSVQPLRRGEKHRPLFERERGYPRRRPPGRLPQPAASAPGCARSTSASGGDGKAARAGGKSCGKNNSRRAQKASCR